MSANNCWDYWGCLQKVKTRRPVYKTRSGRECWFVAEGFAANYLHKTEEGLVGGWKCSWFKENNPYFVPQISLTKFPLFYNPFKNFLFFNFYEE